MGAPVAIGMIVVVAIAVTLGPAVLFLGSKIGLYESKRPPRSRFWRKVGTAVVRWPAPDLRGQPVRGADRHRGDSRLQARLQRPATTCRTMRPTNIGFAAADRHFSQARMNPDILMVDADHDMRNPADMLVLNAVARNVMHTEGIAMVQNITRPLGIPIQHSSIPFQTSIQGQTSNMNLPFQRDQLANQLKTVDATNASIDIVEEQYQLSLSRPHSRRTRRPSRGTCWRPPRSCGTTSRTSTTSSGPCAATSTGNRTASTSRCASRSRSLFDSLDGIDETDRHRRVRCRSTPTNWRTSRRS